MLLELGARTYNLTTRPLIMGILNRTPDSFYDRGAYWEMDAFLARAERLVAEGADLLDVGGVKAGPGPEVSAAEELDRVGPAVEELVARFDVPISVDTWRADVAAACYRLGAVMGNDISGFGDPDYLPAAAAAGAAVVATHIRLRPRVADPDPHYDDLVTDVVSFLAERVSRARQAGIPDRRIVVDAGLDLGKTAEQSARLLAASDRLAALGLPLLLSASNKTFLGRLFDLEVTERRVASVAAHAVGVVLGCRILRVHDVAGSRRVVDTLQALIERSGADPFLQTTGPGRLPAGVPDGLHAVAPDGLHAVTPAGREAAAPEGREAAAPEGREAVTQAGRGAVAPEGREAVPQESLEAVAQESLEAVAPEGLEAVTPEDLQVVTQDGQP